MIVIGFSASFWVLFASKAASIWLSWVLLVLLLLDVLVELVLVLELLSASLDAAWL